MVPIELQELLRNMAFLSSKVNPTAGSRDITVTLAEEYVMLEEVAVHVEVQAAEQAKAPVISLSVGSDVVEVRKVILAYTKYLVCLSSMAQAALWVLTRIG